MNPETTSSLALLLSPGVGNVAVNQALTAAAHAEQSLDELFALPPRRLLELLPHGQETVAHSLSHCEAQHVNRAARLIERVERAGGQALLITDSDYPEAVRTLLGKNAPPILFAAGNFDLPHGHSAAVVGARKATGKGLRIAERCAGAFASEGIPVISGGAQGVDTAAHGAALKAGGETIVVLPQGLLTYRAPGDLMEAVEDGRATILSEFVPDSEWVAHAAVTRNATISALAKIVCVIEPKKEGGSIRTARCALDQGKRVLVHCNEGAGPPLASLLRSGAHPLLDGHGALSRKVLMNHWNAAAPAVSKQGDLF